ncbi:MAG: Lrp/AsnC ligand binding domain-containing protein [Saprospiraceae bacterium]|jgi:Lrp/AsnC family transcriptional regulator, regulator for asnA, asnC and gidA|nr:Lrp/AsnC ligand binding domain-containing protein [Saprospiraceae bacterium]MDP4821466.1 Lrp/AsnC ligand binding domain-containing protein [Saprospiraceae bacterium]MDP4998057.1 Lrp/AsnC ligand binding domain-containing protein [Saprospiraceae bacterium]
MNKIQEVDKLDRQILSRLMKNAKRPYTDIAQELAVSGGTIHVRMKKLEDSGVVKGYQLEVDHEKLGFDVCAFLGIYLEKSSMYDEASAQLTLIPEIVAAHYTTGLYNIFTKVICRDTTHLREVLSKIQSIPGIQRTETFISLEESINRPIELVNERER